ncbi:MAG: hypothetical protein ACRD2H_05545 [Terriglobales bacterium]
MMPQVPFTHWPVFCSAHCWGKYGSFGALDARYMELALRGGSITEVLSST